jgi:hypothetical protein
MHGLAATVFAAFAFPLSYVIDSLAAPVAACATRPRAGLACVEPACSAHVPGVAAFGPGALVIVVVAFASTFTVAYASGCSQHHPSRTSDVHPFSVSFL